MAGYIPEHIIAQVQAATDIVGLIGQYVPLKKAGKDFKGLCPFHKEKTPSFTVSAEKQIYHCFGCKAGGTAFQFLMQHERMLFPEAVRFLAHQVGITVPEEGRGDSRKAAETRSERESLLAALEAAAGFYSEQLRREGGSASRQYLEGRRIQPTTIQQWKLGCAPRAWDSLIKYMRGRGTSASILEKAGLVTERTEGGGHYDRFRGRVMFPIIDVRNRVIGFGARTLEDEQGPKYLNSPETVLFNKSRCLYGLDRAKSAITEKNLAVVVEGYTDVLMAHQFGIPTVVATLGTALTREHINLLRRYAARVVLVYDADIAGEKASNRGIELFLEEDVDVSIATLPGGLDPCDFILQKGARGFEERIEHARGVLEYKLAQARARYDFSRFDEKARATDEILGLVTKISNDVKRNLFVQSASSALGIPEVTLRARVAALSQGSRRFLAEKEAPSAAPANAARTAQYEVVAYLLKQPATAAGLFHQVSPEEFTDETYRTIYQAIRDIYEMEGQIDPVQCLRQMEALGPEHPSGRIVTEIFATGEEKDLSTRVQGSLNWFAEQRRKVEVSALKERTREAQSSENTELTKQLLHEARRRLARAKSPSLLPANG